MSITKNQGRTNKLNWATVCNAMCCHCLLPARVLLSISPPSDISEVLSVMLLRWARVVVSWMKRSLVSTPIMIQSLPFSQMLTFLFHFTAVQSFGNPITMILLTLSLEGSAFHSFLFNFPLLMSQKFLTFSQSISQKRTCKKQFSILYSGGKN